MMTTFRRRYVGIEAWQFVGEGSAPKPAWLRDAIDAGTVWHQGGDEPYMTVSVDGCEFRAALGDWLTRIPSGEIYPCRGDIFASTYEPAEPGEIDWGALPPEAREAVGRANATLGEKIG